jgi:hypothetical protein
MTKFEKAKNWIKENKEEIVRYTCYGAGIIAGGILIGKSVKYLKDARQIVKMPVPEDWGHGTVDALHSDPTGVLAFVVNIPTTDLATVGDSLATIPVPEQFKYANILLTCVEDEFVSR